ncbi:MAG: HAD-IA family hydrolase [Gammaproteobacteria bacterium]|jgi:phosphoglycolate phosphatase
MTHIAAVLFDLDGTLVDTAPDFVRVLNQLRADDQLAPLPYDTIRNQVSNGARALVKLGFALEEASDDFARRLEKLLALYEQGLAVESKLFDGLDTSLRWLEQRNIPWGVVTNKPSRYTLPLLRGLQLDQRCAVTVCPDHVTHKKPHPEPLLTACDWLSVDPLKTLYVGDHIRDIEAGRAAGNITIAAAWGYLEQDTDIKDWQADVILQTPAQLQAFLLDKAAS